MKDLRIVSFTSQRKHGQMNTAPAFYPEGMEKDERKRLMNINKQDLMDEIGLSYKNIFIPTQKNNDKCPDLYEDGYCYTLTKEDVNKYPDLYDFDLNADIVKLTPETKNIAIAYPAADCAVVKAVNLKTNEVVMAHCGGEYIDRYLPMQTIDALGGREKDIRVYISPFAYSMYFDDANNLKWANNDDVWKKYKEEKENDGKTSVKINIISPLLEQLQNRKIKLNHIHFGADINHTDMYYSNSRRYKDKEFAGRNLSGIAIIDNDTVIENKSYIKVIK